MKTNQLMTRGWGRIVFMLSLNTDITPQLPEELGSGDSGGLAGRFQYESDFNWIHVALSAWDVDQCPLIKLVLTLPHDLRERPELANYMLANDLNKQGNCCAAYYDGHAGTLQIRSNIVYSGYQDDPEIEHDSSFEQCEATVNWIFQGLSLGRFALQEIAALPPEEFKLTLLNVAPTEGPTATAN